MRVHPLKQEGDRWACRTCDCAAETVTTSFTLKAPLGFPVCSDFACYELEVCEDVVLGCKDARLVKHAFRPAEALALAPKLTARQREDLVKCAGQSRLLLPGSRAEYAFFEKLDKITNGAHFATRRAAVRRMSHAHLQVALALFALGFPSSKILESYASYSKDRRGEGSRLIRAPTVWQLFHTAESLNQSLESWLRKPSDFFNVPTRPEALRELGPLELAVFLRGSASRFVKRPIVALESEFQVGRLEDAFVDEVPPGEHRCGASGVVGPCREAGGAYVSRALAVCVSTLANLVHAGRARLTDDVCPPSRDDGNVHVFPASGTVRGAGGGAYVLYHANAMPVPQLYGFLAEVQKTPLASLTLTAPFDFDPDVTTKAWATIKATFAEGVIASSGETHGTVADGDEARFAIVATCAEARATRDDAEWGFCPEHLTLLRHGRDGYETIVSRERWIRGGEVYPCRCDEGLVLVPAACVTALPRYCLPIGVVRLPADPAAARVVERSARRVSNTEYKLFRV